MTRALRVTVDHSLCVGNGTCLISAPHVFSHNEDRQSEAVNPAGDPEEMILRAAASCPVSAIDVRVAETGERLFP